MKNFEFVLGGELVYKGEKYRLIQINNNNQTVKLQKLNDLVYPLVSASIEDVISENEEKPVKKAKKYPENE